MFRRYATLNKEKKQFEARILWEIVCTMPHLSNFFLDVFSFHYRNQTLGTPLHCQNIYLRILFSVIMHIIIIFFPLVLRLMRTSIWNKLIRLQQVSFVVVTSKSVLALAIKIL